MEDIGRWRTLWDGTRNETRNVKDCDQVWFWILGYFIYWIIPNLFRFGCVVMFCWKHSNFVDRSWSSQQNLGDSFRSLGPLIPSFPTGFRWKELCKSCFLVSIQRQFHAVRSSLCCARGRTDTDLIDISVGGKGRGGVEKLSLEELQHLVSSVSLCLSFLAWQEGMPFTMSHKGYYL